MIPKKIHYCWFGRGPKDKLFEKCLASWKKFFPGWEIIEWNEDNFDVNFCKYTKRAYELKKYAFVSDVARLKIIYDEGGIYFDTDVEVIRKFDEKLLKEGYFGEEESGLINTGLGFAAKRNNHIIKLLLDSYQNLELLNDSINDVVRRQNLNELIDKLVSEDKDDIYALPCPILNSGALLAGGYKIRGGGSIDGIPIYGPDYFCGFNLRDHHYSISENTYSVHHYNASWQSNKYRRTEQIRRLLIKMFGSGTYGAMKNLKHFLRKN